MKGCKTFLSFLYVLCQVNNHQNKKINLRIYEELASILAIRDLVYSGVARIVLYLHKKLRNNVMHFSSWI